MYYEPIPIVKTKKRVALGEWPENPVPDLEGSVPHIGRTSRRDIHGLEFQIFTPNNSTHALNPDYGHPGYSDSDLYKHIRDCSYTSHSHENYQCRNRVHNRNHQPKRRRRASAQPEVESQEKPTYYSYHHLLFFHFYLFGRITVSFIQILKGRRNPSPPRTQSALPI